MANDACVGLLLPGSDTLAQDDYGLAASRLAADCGHESLARFIDAYALARSEQAALGVAARSGTSRGRSAPRV